MNYLGNPTPLPLSLWNELKIDLTTWRVVSVWSCLAGLLSPRPRSCWGWVSPTTGRSLGLVIKVPVAAELHMLRLTHEILLKGRK